MPSIADTLTRKFAQAVETAFPEQEKRPVELVQSSQPKFGHYQFNSAMKMAKELKIPPRQIAEKIASAIDKNPDIASLEIAGPGFINVHLNPEYLAGAATRMAEDPRLGVEHHGQTERVIVEFSSPNTAKELHVGHLRSTIIGDSLARLMEFLGYDVLRLNHVGDWGTQFGMLIAHLKETEPAILNGEKSTDLPRLVEWYKESKKRFDSDPDFKKRAQLEVVELQAHAPGSIRAWEIICAISRKAYEEIYDLLDVKIKERGESFYNPMLPEIVEDLEEKGLIKVSDGAKCLYPEGFKNREGDPLPLMIQKSDGGYGYDATDMAAIKYRVEKDEADRIIYVTDAGQALHFQMIFKGAEMAGYVDPEKVRLDHVPFGLVLGPDGKKFKTRSGDTERLIDLLHTAIEKAGIILLEKNPEMEEGERRKLAKALGIAAVKYADLSCNRTGDYTFSYQRMLQFEGNTAAYLMYVYVRVQGIKRKVGREIPEGSIALNHPSEISLGLHLLQFVEALEQVNKDLMPNRLTDYLYHLADKFNAFYRDCKVEGSEHRDSRVKLCDLTARTIKQGLHLLGVETVERM